MNFSTFGFEGGTIFSDVITLVSKQGPRHWQVRIHDFRLAMIRLAKQYGNREVTQLLHLEGWHVNHKKIERLWGEEGLQLPHRHKKRKRLHQKNSSIIRSRPRYQNHIWSIDFVHDKLSTGKPSKMLTVLDEFTREGLGVEARYKMGADDVPEVLYELVLRPGRPQNIRSDNGREFIAASLQDWLIKVGIKPFQTHPGSPLSAIASNRLPGNAWENGNNERFNGTLRNEVLNAEWFSTTK